MSVIVWEEIANASLAPCETCAPFVGTVHRQGEGPMPPFHPLCRCYRRVVEIESEGEVGVSGSVGLQSLAAEPMGAILTVNGVGLGDVDRKALRGRLESGELEYIEFDAVVFRDVGNANYYRFRAEDLTAFAASFAQQPFLRNHDVGDIDSRDGTIQDSEHLGLEFVQRIRLTTDRGMRSFLEGQIDRFSIGWYYEGVTCSVCNQDWFSYECSHWPGRKYKLKSGDGETEVTCELIFENPTGKETSAVNAPAVPGTHILSQLVEQKHELQKEGEQMAPELEKEKQGGGVEQPEALDVGVPADTGSNSGAGRNLAEGGDTAGAGQQENGVGDEWAAYAQEQAVSLALAASRLPASAQAAVRSALAGRERVTPADVEAQIEAQRAVLAEAASRATVTDVEPYARVSGMLDGLDKIELAVEGLIAGRRPAEGVRPLTGLRELYVQLSGDYDLHGQFYPENVGLANVTSATLPSIVADAVNKRVVTDFSMLPRFWEPVVSMEDFGSLQAITWVQLGGFGELPTVGEGKAYPELEWADDDEGAAWTKAGGYIGITMESIDKDDTRRLMQAPRALARAAYMSLGKAFTRVFTENSGVGPQLGDGKALFHADHNNVGSSALSTASWTATRTAMRKQSELGSGERLGALTVPKFVMVPSDLETTALIVLASEGLPGTGNNDMNPHAEGDSFEARKAAARRMLIVNDFMTDTNNWAAMADPLMHPTVGMGFRYGRTPEVFSVADRNSGLMFSNDTLPIKVRFFFAVGPQDYRGLYKHNVS